MSELCVFLFGRFSLCYEQQELNCIHTQKARELFCYLLLTNKQYHNRDVLIDILWGGKDHFDSKKYFRKTLWQLHSALRSIEGIPSTNLLEVNDNWIRIVPNTSLWVDAHTFAKGYSLIKDLPIQSMNPEEYSLLQNAVRLYQGDLLEDWYMDWCIYERERLKEMYLQLIGKLMRYCELHSEYEAAIEYGNTILQHDRTREQIHRLLMRLHYLSGSRTDAIHQFNLCKLALHEELDVEPSELTRSLYEKIVKDQFESLEKPQSVDSCYVRTNYDVRDILFRIERLVDVQNETQGRLRNEIQALEHALALVR